MRSFVVVQNLRRHHIEGNSPHLPNGYSRFAGTYDLPREYFPSHRFSPSPQE
jgi:hypothetical protein